LVEADSVAALHGDPHPADDEWASEPGSRQAPPH
jgi:hypothetical protein